MLISQFKRVSLLHVLRARVPYMKHLPSSSPPTTHCTGGVPHMSCRTFSLIQFFRQLAFLLRTAWVVCRIRVAVRILRSKILLVAEPRLAKQETLGSIFAFCASIASQSSVFLQFRLGEAKCESSAHAHHTCSGMFTLRLLDFLATKQQKSTAQISQCSHQERCAGAFLKSKH